MPVARQCSRKRDILEEIARCETIGEVGGQAGTAVAASARERKEEAPVCRREEGRHAIVVGELGTKFQRMDRAELNSLLKVEIGVLLLVAVGDLVQRCEVEVEVVRIGWIDSREGHLRRAAAKIVGEAGRRPALIKRLCLGIAVSLSVASFEVHGRQRARPPDRIEIARQHLGVSEPVDRIKDDTAAAGCGCDCARDNRIVHDGRVGEGPAAADRVRAPGEEILVEVVGVEPRVEAGEVDLERIRRLELDRDISAVALALLLEER